MAELLVDAKPAADQPHAGGAERIDADVGAQLRGRW